MTDSKPTTEQVVDYDFSALSLPELLRLIYLELLPDLTPDEWLEYYGLFASVKITMVSLN